jgi:hypothetical protein
MSSNFKIPNDGAYVIRGLSSCEIQGFSICHRDGFCSCCPIALAHDNPGTPLHEFMKLVSS